jgi:hypothetical protein
MTGTADYGVGYAQVPRLGVIAALHALAPRAGRTLCDRPVAIAWSADDSASTMVDCAQCPKAIGRREVDR